MNVTTQPLCIANGVADAPFYPVACVNWPEYPYKPDVSVRLDLADDAFCIDYRVSEQAVLARYDQDGDRVWTDSCVECFIRPADSDVYYNIECSCIATLLIARGNSREGREPLPADALSTVERTASLGRQPFGLLNQPTSWTLSLRIPFAVFGDDARMFCADSLRFNVYKCGDDLPTPHFVSLFPIPIQEPNFHRPDFFGTLKLR